MGLYEHINMLCPYDVCNHHILMWCLRTDVAISAPYGMDISGNALPGTVYIYAGAGNSVIHLTPIQVMIMYTYLIYLFRAGTAFD